MTTAIVPGTADGLVIAQNRRRPRPLLLRGPAIAKLWLFYAVVIGAPPLLGGPGGARNVVAVLSLALVSAMFWVAATPVIFRISRRFPADRSRWFVSAAAHLGAMTVCAVANAVIAGMVTVFRIAPAPPPLPPVIDDAIAAAIPFYAAIAAVGMLLDSRARAHAAELDIAEAQRLSTEARLQALRARLNPHFLFNALNTVAMAVRRADRQEALAVVLNLSTLLRSVLRYSDPDTISLARELDFIRQYVEIEQVRFRDRLNVVWDVEPAACNAAVPAMILQPLVENALRHGIGARAEASTIALRVAIRDDVLVIVIEDDGPGFRDDRVDGVGLANVRNRLSLHYGDRAGIETTSTAGGAVVRVSFPYSGVSEDAEVQDADRR